MVINEKEKAVIDSIFDRGAKVVFPDGLEALAGFGEEFRPGLFLWCSAFFESSFHFHFIRFGEIIIHNQNCVELASSSGSWWFVVIDQYEDEFVHDVERWKKERSEYIDSWNSEKRLRENWNLIE